MDAIAGLDEAGFRARPDRTSWTAAEVLAHLLHIEQALRGHAQAAADQRDYVVAGAPDDEREESARRARSRAVPQIVHGLLAERRDTHCTLAGLSERDLRHAVRHRTLGETTVGALLRHVANHESEHASQIRELRRAIAARST